MIYCGIPWYTMVYHNSSEYRTFGISNRNQKVYSFIISVLVTINLSLIYSSLGALGVKLNILALICTITSD